MEDNLIYKLDNIEGVEIDVLCKSLKAIEDEFHRFTNNRKTLVVKEVRKGSGIFEFKELVIIPVLAGMDIVNTVIQFVEYIDAAKNVILKKKDKLPNNMPMTKATVENVKSMFSPVITGNNNTVNFYIGMESAPPAISVGREEYKEIKARSKNTLKELKSSNDLIPEDGIYNKVLFRWMRTGFGSINVGNQGIIRQIQDKPVKVIFANDNSETKTEMTTSTLGIDWQKVKYIVDAEAMIDDNHVVAYKILKNYPEDSITDVEENDSELF